MNWIWLSITCHQYIRIANYRHIFQGISFDFITVFGLNILRYLHFFQETIHWNRYLLIRSLFLLVKTIQNPHFCWLNGANNPLKLWDIWRYRGQDGHLRKPRLANSAGDGGGDWDGWEKHMEPKVGQIHNAIHAILGYIIRISHDIKELTNHNHNKS